MHRKGLVVGILILLVGVNIGSTFAGDADVKIVSSVSFDGNTLYVGGSGPNNYTTIQSAINDASDGDTVFVYSGIYNETVSIQKQINLIGEDKNTTIIDAKRMGNCITIEWEESVNITGFTFQNSWTDKYYGGLYITAGTHQISNNIFLNNACGIVTEQGGLWECEINNNIFINNDIGIYLLFSNDNIISENIFLNNTDGVVVSGFIGNQVVWTNNIIIKNYFNNNTQGIQITASFNKVYNNTFLNNELSARFCGYFNRWKGNYWDEPRDLPKIILGRIGNFIGLIPWFNIDWFPAQEPYDIGV